VRDRLQAEPEPDPGVSGIPTRRPILWRLAAAALIAGFALIAVWVLSGSYAPPDPAECAALRELTTRTPDVVYEMDRIGCDNPPYGQLDLDPTAQR
jgi:hypothetical protein